MVMAKTEGDILLFDGDCGFCQHNIARIEKYFNPKASLTAYQNFDFRQGPLSREEAESAVAFITGDRAYYLGSEALAKWLQTGNGAGKTIGQVMEFPGIAQAAKRLYGFIAKNKKRISSASSCPPK